MKIHYTKVNLDKVKDLSGFQNLTGLDIYFSATSSPILTMTSTAFSIDSKGTYS